MIEYKDNFITAIDTAWHNLPKNVQYHELKFRHHKFRIGDSEFKENTRAFEQAFKIDRTWRALTK